MVFEEASVFGLILHVWGRFVCICGVRKFEAFFNGSSFSCVQVFGKQIQCVSQVFSRSFFLQKQDEKLQSYHIFQHS